MPLYEYECEWGHVLEKVRPIGTETIPCKCMAVAHRRHVYHTEIVGPTVDTRGMYRRYREASQEIDHAASVVESSTGGSVVGAPVWKMSKSRAAAMDRAGEPFRPLEGS